MYVSCGALIYNSENKILLGHVTGQNHWDIPKGLKEENETELEAAIRETKEETNIQLNEKDLEILGRFKYRKEKDLYLVKYKLQKDIELSDLKCNFFFTNKYTSKSMPEIDDFAFFHKEDALFYLCTSMRNLLKDII